MLAPPITDERVPKLAEDMIDALASECSPPVHAVLRVAMPQIVRLLIEMHEAPYLQRAGRLRELLRDQLRSPTYGAACHCDQIALSALVRSIVHAFNVLTDQELCRVPASHWFG